MTISITVELGGKKYQAKRKFWETDILSLAMKGAELTPKNPADVAIDLARTATQALVDGMNQRGEI